MRYDIMVKIILILKFDITKFEFKYIFSVGLKKPNPIIPTQPNPKTSTPKYEAFWEVSQEQIRAGLGLKRTISYQYGECGFHTCNR